MVSGHGSSPCVSPAPVPPACPPASRSHPSPCSSETARCCRVARPPADPLTGADTGDPHLGPSPAPTAADPDAEPTLLRHPQVRARPGLAALWAHRPPGVGSPELSPAQGLWSSPPMCPPWAVYASLLHCYQPAHPTLAVEVLINGGRVWQGEPRRWTPGERAVRGPHGLYRTGWGAAGSTAHVATKGPIPSCE